jgi:uncharacterized membrane protein (GlpM family)
MHDAYNNNSKTINNILPLPNFFIIIHFILNSEKTENLLINKEISSFNTIIFLASNYHFNNNHVFLTPDAQVF